MNQGQLFQQPLVEETMSDGAAFTDWQRAVIKEWHRRHPQPLVYVANIPLTPSGVYCLRCKTPSVIFPGESLEYPENKGYCICPQCSQPKQAAAA